MRILIRGGLVIDPRNERKERLDILIEGGVVEKLDRNIPCDLDTILIDAEGRYVSPGLIDVHTHLREPGYEYKETIRTGTKAAVRGGFTGIVCMANTDPVNDNRSVTEFIKRRAQEEGLCRVYPCGAISKGLKGLELAEIGEMYESGIVALSDDGKSVKNSGLMRKALEYAKIFSLPIISHCEDEDLATGCINEGPVSVITGLPASPAIAEEIVVRRDIEIAKYVEGRIHITHLSTKGGTEILREEKRRFRGLSSDTCPHYFLLTEEAVLEFDTNAKVNPPLRTKEDVSAIKEALRDGTIDMISSDHAPHDAPSKEVEFALASYGISGLETAFSLSLTLFHEGVLSIEELIRKLSDNPARFLNLPIGEIREGGAADIVVFDPYLEWVVDKERFFSKGKNTPFHGWRLKGKVLLTIVDGKIVFRDETF